MQKVIAQCPAYTYQINVKNDCGQPLCGYPVTFIKNIGTTLGFSASTGLTSCGSSGILDGTTCYPLSLAHPSYENTITIAPGNASSILCCNYAIPTSNCATYSLSALTVTPASFIATGIVSANYTVSDPYQAKYSVAGLTLDMTTTQVIYKCSASATIPIVNNTLTWGTAVQYKVMVRNSSVSKTLDSYFYSGSYAATLPTTLPTTTPPLAVGSWYVIEVYVRCNGSTKEGCITRGHFKFGGVVPASVANFNINSTALAITASASPMPDFYVCTPVNAINTSTGGSYQYKYEVDNVTSSGAVISGTTSGLVSSWFTYPAPATGQDLTTTFPILATSGGGKLFRIRITTQSSCSSITSTKYFRLSTVPGNIKLTYLASDQPINTSTLPITAPLVSKNAARFSYLPDPAFPSGSISSYSISVNKVNCSTGVAVSPAVSLPTTTTTLSPPASSLSGVIFDGLFGGTFAANFSAGDCGQATIKLTNPCSTQTFVTYFKLGANNYGRLSASVESTFVDAINLYPTLFDNTITCDIQSSEAINSVLHIINLKGELVKSIDLGLLSDSVTNNFQIDLSDLASGLYIYRLSNNAMMSGKIIKQ